MAEPKYQQYPQYEDAGEGGESVDFRNLLYTLLEKSWVIILCLIAAVFVTMGYLRRCPEIYAATVVVQVAQETPKILGGAGVHTDEDLRSQETLKTIEKIMQSRAIFERVIVTNRLDRDPRFVRATGEATTEQLISRLDGMVGVRLQSGTRLMNVIVEHTDRELTAQIANSLVREYSLQNYEQQTSKSDVATGFLMEKADELKLRMHAAEQALQNYRRTMKSVPLEDRSSLVNQKLSELSSRLGQAGEQRIKLETEFTQAQRSGDNVPALTEVRSIGADPGVVDAQNKLAQQEVALNNLKQRYLGKHPKFIEAQNQINEWRNALTNAVVKAVMALRSAYEAARSTEAELLKAFKEQEALVNELVEQTVKYSELDRHLQSERELYDAVVKQMKQTSVGKDWDPNKVRVVQPAYVPERPIKPNKRNILLTGLVAGLGCGLLLALGLAALDSSLKTPDQAESFVRLPILSAIPRVRSLKAAPRQIIMGGTGGDAFAAEAFRTLRTTLAMLGPEGTRRTFLFTSALPEEGKTFCAINFAASLAQQGLRTLLIEADLRCPAVGAALGLKGNKAPGVTDYLVGQASLKAIVQAVGVENLSCATAGNRAPNPSELLAQDTFTTLLQEALLQFDRVVVDSAPIQPVSDSLLLVNRVQTVCLVVRANQTPRKSVQRAVQVLQKGGTPLAGIIFNRLTKLRGEAYYDYTAYPEYVTSSEIQTRS